MTMTTKTEYVRKFETRTVMQPVEITDYTDVLVTKVVHTLNHHSNDPDNKDSQSQEDKSALARIAREFPTAFVWRTTAEGADFWLDVTKRLQRIAGNLPRNKE